MDEATALQEKVIISSSPPKCCHCRERPGNPELGTYRYYCDVCWNDMNRRRRATMRAAGIKRSLETKAKMSASKRANPKADPAKWKLYYDFYLEQLKLEDGLQRAIDTKS